MKAEVNERQCIGCGLCHVICPEVFSIQGEEEKVKVCVETVPDMVRDRCREAAHDCLFEAIALQV